MRADIYPLQVLLLTVSGWVNRHQADVIEYLVEENRVLKEQLRGRKPRLTDDQRRRLAVKAKLLGRKVLDRVVTIVTPDTGLKTYYVLFLVDLKTRRVNIAGVTTNPGEAFIAQVARNLTDLADGFLRAHRFLICDRDTKFTAQFKRILKDSGVDVILTPRQAPNCNAFAERFVLSIKSECLWKMIFFGETSLRRAVSEFVAHYHVERAHQGLGNERIEHVGAVGHGDVVCEERLGGLLKCYRRAA